MVDRRLQERERVIGQEIVCSLKRFATVFQAEVRAIVECARASLMEGIRNHPIAICSDTRAALMALDGFLITSKDFRKYRDLLEELTVNNSVNLLWVPRHSNNLGNEKAETGK